MGTVSKVVTIVRPRAFRLVDKLYVVILIVGRSIVFEITVVL